MDGMQKVLEAYNFSKSYRLSAVWCGCFCKKRKQTIEKMYFFDRWLKVTQACLPDEIKWENIGYSHFNRRIRKLVIWIIAILLLVFGLMGVILVKV
jgi:hypothetical protein